MPHRLGADHANARYLAAELAKIPSVRLNPEHVQTNIVIFDISGTGLAIGEINGRLKARGVLMSSANVRQMRAVTHYDVSREDCATAASALAEVLSATGHARA